MDSYEELILASQEGEYDECATCPFKGVDTCKNQCMEVEEVHNPYF